MECIDGLLVGRRLGSREGFVDGDVMFINESSTVGNIDGNIEGYNDGVNDGSNESVTVGLIDGSKVEITVGRMLGN